MRCFIFLQNLSFPFSISFIMDDEPVNDLALIKTDRIIERSQFYSLPICTMATLREQLFQTIIAACGMGSVFGNKSKPIFPETLQVGMKNFENCYNHLLNSRGLNK